MQKPELGFGQFIWMELLERILNLVCLAFILQRSTAAGAREDKADVDFANDFTEDTHLKEKEPTESSTNLVFGYLNLFSDGVVCVPYSLFSSFFLINFC